MLIVGENSLTFISGIFSLGLILFLINFIYIEIEAYLFIKNFYSISNASILYLHY